MIIIDTGAPGIGKTKTAAYLMETTLNSAVIDGDPLLGINHFNRTSEDRCIQYKNTASIASNYFEAGFRNIFISFVYGQSQLDYQKRLLKDIDQVEVFILLTEKKH